GAALVEPVVRALQRNEFEEPSLGVRLLLARPRDAALEALRGLVLAPQGLDPDVLSAVSGGFRELRRIGDDATALRLTDPARPSEVRADAVLALEDDEADRALPLLAALVRDGDPTVASHAASVLEARGGPRERALLQAGLFDAVWRPFEQDVLDFLVAPADDAVFAFLVRAVRTGTKPLKEAIFQSLAHPRSPVRGRRALAIVHLAIEDPALGIDTGTIGKAIAAVDSRAAVAFIGSRWRGWRSPGILVRNLRVSTGPAPREFALRLAEEIPDGDAGMLVELATVLAEACEKAPERTDPFWRRLLSSRSEELVRVAVGHLRRVPHGPMSDLLVPLLADRREDAGLRREALLALTGEAGEPPTSLLWSIASDRLEDSDLREACAVALLPRADPAIREQALAWLSDRSDEPSGAVVRIAELAGRGATAAQAADLLQLLQDDLAERYAHRPYFHTRDEQPDALRAYRMAALVRGLGASDDGPSLDALADLLFDPRFAAYSAEARRREALRRRPGGGPLCAVEDPPEIEILLHQAGESPNETPASPIPPEASEIADAMARRGAEEGARRVVAAIDRAATTGRLALFNDVYLLWLANRLRQGGRDAVSRGAGPEAESAAAALDGALALTWPAAGPEELVAAERRTQRLDREGSWAEAAAAAAEATRLAARTGLADIPPARWLERALPPGPTWLMLRAQQDLLLGAAAASAGKAEEALDHFQRGVARAPYDPRVLRGAARLKAIVGFDLATAEAEALRAIELERRQGEDPSPGSLRALQRVRTRKGAVPPRDGEPQRSDR
ncbi:MAG TPA: hypothetical protein VND21_01170, partial [Planctomycetota bacterium]|nr:hypothetical protein [Planctomycetota bacterium]